MPAELLYGLVVGLVGLALTAVIKGLDWGWIWVFLVIGGILLVTPRRLANSALSPSDALKSILVGGAVVGYSFGRQREAVVWPFVVSLGGAWAAVPDTETISVLIGSALVFAIASRPLGWSRASWHGGAAVGVLSALVVLAESTTRPAAVVGATGALAMAALWRKTPAAWISHIALVGFWSRVAARSATGLGALFSGLAVTVAVVALSMIWRRFMTKRQGSQ